MGTDRIYTEDQAPIGAFEFNEQVAKVFPDMLRRSIPGYAASIQAIGSLAARYVRAGTRCYDLGCSLGAATMAMKANIAKPGCTIVAVDNSPAMVARCEALVVGLDGPADVRVEQSDIRQTEIAEASMVVMNYTLQFLPPEERAEMLARIADGTRAGGILVLSEKVIDEDPEVESLLQELHIEFKRRHAYSDLEISRKRKALEDVLIPESVATHIDRILASGFRHAGVWLRYFNFASIVAIR